MSLCEFCHSIKFGALGFHDIQDPVHEASGYTRLYERVLGDWIKPKKRSLGEILEGAKEASCEFCKKIAECCKEKSPEIQTYAVVHFHFNRVFCKPKSRCLIRFWVTIELPTRKGSKEVCVLQFQKCAGEPVKVQDLCSGGALFDWENKAPEEAFSGRLRPLVVDTRLFRKWKEACAEEHDSCRDPSFITGERPAWLRLIDVRERCLVDCFLDENGSHCVGKEGGITYAALSYVWGKYHLTQRGKVMPELHTSTEERFREPQSLSRNTVLSTIDDAIEVAQSLGENFLWVDCLCIKQDDGADKGQFIPHMDVIYGSASFTIVAASGVDADAGLSGVKGNRRKQVPFSITGVSLLQTLDEEWQDWGTRGQRSHIYQYLGDSLWCKRGWTLQEKILSARALIFSPKQVYWECLKASWCEDSVWETKYSPSAFRHCFGAMNNIRRPWFGSRLDRSPYRELVEEYTARSLTENSDALDAFAGILSSLRKETGQEFIWALPTSFLGEALLWECYALPSPQRRLGSCSMSGRIMALRFPSWSWLGWVGKVEIQLMSDPQDMIRMVIYYLDGTGTLVQAPDTPRNDDPRTKITLEDIPESIRALSTHARILFFWSHTAELQVGFGVSKSGSKKRFFRHNGQNLCGLHWSHQPAADLGDGELAEFVLVGENDLLNRLILLVIAREDFGVAHRRGQAEIKSSDWNKLNNRVWKLISLG